MPPTHVPTSARLHAWSSDLGAARHRADVFLTFTTRHFSALVREGDPRVLAPPGPPALLCG